MALRSLLGLLAEDARTEALAREGGRAFVSAALRPYTVAALADTHARPTLVVVGDDRAARDMAADLRAWLAPRPVRYYPSRGVAYESHLTPPPHLVGLRVAALDALSGQRATRAEGQPVVVVCAVALSEKVPDPALRPHSFTLAVGELLDLEECATDLVAAGYERVDQVEERGQFAMRGGLLDIYPATEERAVRVDIFDEGDRVPALVLNLHPALARGCECGGDRAGGRAGGRAPRAGRNRCAGVQNYATREGPSWGHSSLAQGEREEPRTRSARTWRSCCRWIASARCWSCSARSGVLVAAEEELAPTLRDHWSDVCAAFQDADAHHLYVTRRHRNDARERTRTWLSALASDQEIQLRAQPADTAARSLAEAEPELEKLVRSGYRTVVAFPRRGEGERAAYNLGRLQASVAGRRKGRGGPAPPGRARGPRCASPPPRCARALSHRR